MARKHRNEAVPTPLSQGSTPYELKKQSCYGDEPWKPGEIPIKDGFSQIPVIAPMEDVQRTARREYSGVERPTSRGRKYPLQMIIQGVEGKFPDPESGMVTKGRV